MRYLLVLSILFFTYLHAKEVAVVKSMTGEVVAKTKGKIIQVKNGDKLNEKMVLLTKKDGEVKLIFKDNSILVLGPNSILILEKYVFEPENQEYDVQLNLNKGIASFESGDIGKYAPENFIFRTPDSAVTIRGTKFIVKVQ